MIVEKFCGLKSGNACIDFRDSARRVKAGVCHQRVDDDLLSRFRARKKCNIARYPAKDRNMISRCCGSACMACKCFIRMSKKGCEDCVDIGCIEIVEIAPTE